MAPAAAKHPAAPAPLLHHGRAVAALIALAAAGIVVLGLRYAGADRPGRVDSAIDFRVRHHLRDHLRVLHHLVSIADPVPVVLICAALALVFYFAGRRRAAILAVFGPAVAVGFAEFVLKPLIDRRLLYGLAFPSGHTTAAVSIAVVLAVALIGPSRPGWPWVVRWSLSGLALLFAAAVAIALVGSGYHYATDTIGGFCVAVGVVLGVAWAIDTIADAGDASSGDGHSFDGHEARLPNESLRSQATKSTSGE